MNNYYITFNDQYSGIYQSQVIDVVNYLEKLAETKYKLVSFFPLQGFKGNRMKILDKRPNSIVIPMVLGITYWKWYKLILWFFTKRKAKAICRGPLACELALGLFEKVIYDGRAAAKAEIEEYDITGGNLKLNEAFVSAERNAVMRSDFRISVSNKLVEYWKKEFDYTIDKHAVIPCTIDTSFSRDIEFPQNNERIKVVYSGGIGKWQSFDLIIDFVEKLLINQSNVEVLFLTKSSEKIDELIKKFPDRCKNKFVDHKNVFDELAKSDYGLLLRENTITNQVSSPVKFAEYLSAGLMVLISPNVGDFSEFVNKYNCGQLVTNETFILKKIDLSKRYQNAGLVRTFFSKDSFEIDSKYRDVVST